jgi:DNA-binding MarR family transcriptional regulator
MSRQTDSTDRRAAVVTVTAVGRAKLAEWEQAHEQRIGAVLEQLDSRDRQTIRQVLPALNRLTRQLNKPLSL